MKEINTHGTDARLNQHLSLARHLRSERERWEQLMRSCEQINIPRITRLIHSMCSLGHAAPPEQIIECQSPRDIVGTLLEMHARDPSRQILTKEIWAPDIRRRVRAATHCKTLGQTDDLRHTLWGPSLRWNRSWPTIQRETAAIIIRALHIPYTFALNNVDEQHWAAFGSCLLKYVGIPLLDDLEPQMRLAEECGWWFASSQVCIVTNRPTTMHYDEQDRLHCDHAPAITYRDGWEICVWHGVEFPNNWLDKKTLTAEVALHQENIELRRVACEILGWDEILQALNAEVVNKDRDPQVGVLLRVMIPGVSRHKEQFLRVVCGTGRTFALPVPPNVRTAREANAWTYGLAANDYDPEVRT